MIRLTVDVLFPKTALRKKRAARDSKSPTKRSAMFKQDNANPNRSSMKRNTTKLDIIGEEVLESPSKDQQIETVANDESKRPCSALFQDATKLLEVVEKQDSAENLKKKSRIHPVTNYADSVNMWEKLFCLEKEEKNVTRYPNGRSMFTIQVSERIFKLKKNPLYQNNTKLIQLLKSVVSEEQETEFSMMDPPHAATQDNKQTGARGEVETTGSP